MMALPFHFHNVFSFKIFEVCFLAVALEMIPTPAAAASPSSLLLKSDDLFKDLWIVSAIDLNFLAQQCTLHLINLFIIN